MSCASSTDARGLPALRLVLGDQLTPHLAALGDAVPGEDTILLAEVAEEAGYVRHHRKKLVFVLSCMRHFAEELRASGHTVRYVKLDDPGNSGSLRGEVARALEETDCQRLVATLPGEYRLSEEMREWEGALGVPVELREDTRFIASTDQFARWARGRKSLRMEYFYREMRRETGLLMEDGAPVGGAWNFDADNRKPIPKSLAPPPRATCQPDRTTGDVMEMVRTRFDHHFGDIEPFYYATTRQDAEQVCEAFARDILPGFGDYQDAMARGEPWLWHGVIGLYLNIGLLDPLSVCQRAERAWQEGAAPLNAVEGFIRQILGWREYVRGLYWLKMPGYRDTNFLKANRALPGFYWSCETDMACMAETIGQTRRHAYAHHIQRLMVTGNFALIAGLDPAEVNEWYMIVYADAYEWVELPNTHGMALFADGGIMASKPYAASGNYINKMSDYCGSCRYNPKVKSGEGACPFNLLYWDFLARNRETLSANPRMGLAMKNLDRKDQNDLDTIRSQAAAFLDSVGAKIKR